MFNKIIAHYQLKRKARQERRIIQKYWRDHRADALASGLWPTPRPVPVPVPSGGGRPPKKRDGGR